jgi:hypothetical protein
MRHEDVACFALIALWMLILFVAVNLLTGVH